MMKDLETSIVESLDGSSNPEIFPWLPYLLQDLEEIGADPRLIEKMVRTHIIQPISEVLDLGCGKGAVSVHLARQFGCKVTGIDGMPEFLGSANLLAEKHRVSHLCKFIVGDIREEIKNCQGFDLIVLGAIGPVFGFIGDTLQAILQALKPNAYVIIDDGFKEDNTMEGYNKVCSRTEFYKQINESGFNLVHENIIPPEELSGSNQYIQNFIVSRAEELIKLYPEKAHLFQHYVQMQEDEIDVMENHLMVGMWLLQKKS